MPAEDPTDGGAVQQDLLDQMRQSLGLLRVAFDSTDEAMLIVDHHQTIRWANQKAADFFSQGMTALLVGQDLGERVACELPGEQSAEKASKQPLQRVFETSQGERRLLISAATASDQAPQNMLSMVIWKQITNLNELFVLVIIRDLDPAERALDQQRTFLQSVAHELRTPLALLSGSLFRLRKLIPSAASALAHLKTAEAESKRIGHLVDQLMLLSDLDTNQFPWKLEVADLVALVNDWKHQLPQPDQQCIHLPNGATPILVKVDRDAFRRVLDQLLQNSLEFSDGLAKVWIEMQRQQQEVCLVFSDSGPGLCAEPRDQTIDIFQRFQRLEQHRSAQRGDGCGLGLAIVRELMHGMGGDAVIAPATDSNQRSGLCLQLKLPRANVPQA